MVQVPRLEIALKAAPAQGGDILTYVPKNFSKLDYDVVGQLYLGPTGYVYKNISRRVIWLKFVSMVIYLPIYATWCKCGEIFNKAIGVPYPLKGGHDFSHIKKLISIAWRASIGSGHNLMARVEEFALAELSYNAEIAPIQEMFKPRSIRLREGVYFVSCLHPLFHISQYQDSSKVKTDVEHLTSTLSQLEEALHSKKSILPWPIKKLPLLLTHNPYLECSEEELVAKIREYQDQLKPLQRILLEAKRCEKYAYKAILSSYT